MGSNFFFPFATLKLDFIIIIKINAALNEVMTLKKKERKNKHTLSSDIEHEYSKEGWDIYIYISCLITKQTSKQKHF